MSDIKVHILDPDRTMDVYAVTQCGYIDSDGVEHEIRDGEVFVAVDEGVIGFLAAAWPVAVVWPQEDGYAVEPPPGGLHHIDWPNAADLPVTYRESILKACEIAEADADVTGHTSWSEQAGYVRTRLG